MAVITLLFSFSAQASAYWPGYTVVQEYSIPNAHPSNVSFPFFNVAAIVSVAFQPVLGSTTGYAVLTLWKQQPNGTWNAVQGVDILGPTNGQIQTVSFAGLRNDGRQPYAQSGYNYRLTLMTHQTSSVSYSNVNYNLYW
ncbi:hypothetical protein I6N90_16525 [Paenibacillus sp. GSMTC-2017]|uniref:hypothetical protein n=1 Tax=Paenibacillus sp. GSMTC-2017 TaxID=2794350 RepID=UPI0018D5CB03|nr:hypothetical protein [Paenibacillus sp. GSMTC-2017]MBH5319405.1 hypothetical protein [Paenibacillus sp. GSMTC-2017]